MDLLSPLSFERVLSIKNEVVQPRWDIDILVHVTEEGEYLRFLMHMVNKTSVDKKNMGYLPRVFDAKIFVVGNENVEFQNLKLDYFSSSYKEREGNFVNNVFYGCLTSCNVIRCLSKLMARRLTIYIVNCPVK